MPKFITIGYGDEAGYRRTAETVRDASHAADAKRMRAGDLMGEAIGFEPRVSFPASFRIPSNFSRRLAPIGGLFYRSRDKLRRMVGGDGGIRTHDTVSGMTI